MSGRLFAGRIIPFDRFPGLHRTLWKEGLTERDRYGGRPYGATLSTFTVDGARDGWGRFLATCPEHERSQSPADLVVPSSIRRFVASMEQGCNCGNTIANRIWQVRTALAIMCPEADFAWITSPDGADVRSLFASERRPIKIYHPSLLYEWGLDLMNQALRINDEEERAVSYRDGLLIAVLAARAPRLRSLAAVRLGVQFVRHDERFRFVFSKQDLKWRRSLGTRLALRSDRPV